MDGKTRRLVADEKVGVLVEDSEVLADMGRRPFRQRGVRARLRGVHDDDVSLVQELGDGGARPVHPHLLRAHELVEVGDRHLAEALAQELVEPLAGGVPRHPVLVLQGLVSLNRETRQVPSGRRVSSRRASRLKEPPPWGRMSRR